MAGTRRLRHRLVWCSLAVACGLGVAGGALLGGAEADARSDAELVVATLEVEPFVVRDGNVPAGFMFEVWEQVAAELGLEYRVRWIESLDDLRDVIEAGEVDVAVAPLSPSEGRERRIDFTSPVVTSGPVVAVHERTLTPTSLPQAVFNLDVLLLMFWGGIGLLILGHLEWWFERRQPDGDFSPGYVRGVWDGVWWAMVTVTTVGYGDSTPRTGRGRVIAMLAMIGSLFLAGAFVAEVTTKLQSERVSIVADAEDLDGQPVGVVNGAVYQAVLDERGVETIGYRTQRAAFEGAEAGEVDVVVADLYTVEAIGADFGLISQDEVLFEDPISFVVPQGSELREDINGVLATLRQDGTVKRIVDRWVE